MKIQSINTNNYQKQQNFTALRLMGKELNTTTMAAFLKQTKLPKGTQITIAPDLYNCFKALDILDAKDSSFIVDITPLPDKLAFQLSASNTGQFYDGCPTINVGWDPIKNLSAKLRKAYGCLVARFTDMGKEFEASNFRLNVVNPKK